MEKRVLVFALLFMAIGFAQLEKVDIIVVRGDVLFDYIPALAYASHEKIPIILIQPEEIQKNIAEALSSYTSTGKNLLIIGGKDAISEKTEAELRKLGFSVSRLWDWDRYGTAARIAIDLWKTSKSAVIVQAESSKNLLIAEKIALRTNSPVLFTKKYVLPDVTKKALRTLGAEKIYLVGNVSENVLKDISSLAKVEIAENVVTEKIETNIKKQDNYLVILGSTIISVIIIILILLAIVFFRRKSVQYIILDPDEEKIVELLEIHGTLTQKRIAELSGFSKPKTSRLLKSLLEKGVIERLKYKKTQKIRLKQK